MVIRSSLGCLQPLNRSIVTSFGRSRQMERRPGLVWTRGVMASQQLLGLRNNRQKKTNARPQRPTHAPAYALHPTQMTGAHHSSHTQQAGTRMAPPRLRTVLQDYRPPSAACHVLPSEPVPLGGSDDDDAGAVVRMRACKVIGRSVDHIAHTPPSGPLLPLSQTPPPHDEELFLTPDRRQVVSRPLGGPTVHKQWRFPSPIVQVTAACHLSCLVLSLSLSHSLRLTHLLSTFSRNQALWAYFDLSSSATNPGHTGPTPQPPQAQQQCGAFHTITSPHTHTHTYTSHSRPNPNPPTTHQATARCLCVLRDPELLFVYPPDGQVYEVALPCQAQRLWALGSRGGGGLLIQRQPVRCAACVLSCLVPWSTDHPAFRWKVVR